MSLPSETIAADVRATLQAFQDGYTHRSSASLDTFMNLFVADASLEVVGTSAVARAIDELKEQCSVVAICSLWFLGV